MKEIEIKANDGLLLAANVFKPDSDAKGTVLLCPGLGIPKEFYFQFCEFLSLHGYICIVFDYRGLGKRSSSLQEINLRNWGIEDIPGALDYLKGEHPHLKLYFIGHSIGGQIAGLISNHHLIERFIFISSTGGYWREFNFPLNLYTYFLFHVQIPLMVLIFGYMPKSLTYRGVAISKGVASEWAAWSREKEYIRSYLKKNRIHHCYNEIQHKIDWISFEDDPIATDKALTSMMNYYPNAHITQHSFNPKEFGISRIGHSGFFTKKAKDAYWSYPLDLLVRGCPGAQ